MTHIEELQLIQELSKDVKGDETSKLQKEIIAMELSLGILKKSRNDDHNKYEKKKAEKGYIWRSGRDIKSGKNYAEKILKSHKRNLRKSKKKKQLKKSVSASTSSLPSFPSLSSTKCHSIAIQSDLTQQQKQQNMINNFFHASNDQKDDESCNLSEENTKKSCYHCFALSFKIDMVSIEADGKYFCNDDCLLKYIKSTMIQCSDGNCTAEFVRENGSRFEGQWFCKVHFEECCVNSTQI